MKEVQNIQQKSETQDSPKKTYISPKLTRHGAVEELTQLLPNPGPSNPIPK